MGATFRSMALAMAGACAFFAFMGVASAATAPPKYVIESAGFSAPQSMFDTGASVPCPTGTVVWGGGVYFSAYSPPVSINTNTWDGGTPGAWQVRVNNTHPFTANFGVNAICARKPNKYQLAFTQVADPAGTQAGGVATCPKGTVVLSGGIKSTADVASVYLTTARPTSGRTFRAVQWNGSSADQPFFVYALCAERPPGYVRVSSTVTVAPNTGGFSETQCPTGTSVLGGGVGVASPNPAVIPFSTSSLGGAHRWDVWVENTTAGTQQMSSFAICAA
jgi:hypothetical protein